MFAIGDLHLPGPENKTMDIFGPAWENHRQRLQRNWQQLVRPQDYVLCPGDLSWAMDLNGAASDLQFLGSLPGNIIIIKGNHDYWWQSISQLRSRLPANVKAIQNDFVTLPEGRAVCGTRGWILPQSQNFNEKCDRKVYLREVNRLQLSLNAAQKAGHKVAFVMLHYPPFAEGGVASEFAQILEERQVPVCVYGHLHGDSIYSATTGTVNGVRYHLVSADAVGFAPKLIETFNP